MSDIGGGPVAGSRSQNGGSRPIGAVVAASGGTARVVTPTDIMRRRREKEAERRAELEARQREQDSDAERRVEGQRRMSTERRSAAAAAAAAASASAGAAGDAGGATAGVSTAYRSGEAIPVRRTGGSRRSGGDPSVPQEVSTGKRTYAGSTSNPAPRAVPAPANAPASYPPASSRAQEPQDIRRSTDGSSLPQPVSAARTRAASASQPGPRPVPQQPQTSRAASATHSGQQQASQTRATSGPGGTTRAQGGPSAATSFQRQQPSQPTATQPSRAGTISSFPHAFERWEQLSSHWEGLTSYWIKRLEGNSEEMSNQPINQQLARQVTDLSAAGANLFHAVVELQRLRASSERKFQRWFFETRSEQERTTERIAQLERELQDEKQARADEAANGARREAQRSSAEESQLVKRQADQMVKEMKRELQISRDEARRGWEEIGRMEQAERDRTFSLKRGLPTLVGGVQVVPMPQDSPGRQTKSSQGGLSSHPVGPNETREGEVGGYGTYDPARSETDTDPFTEGGREANMPPAPQVPAFPASYQQQQQTSASAAAQAMSAGATTGASPPRYRSSGPAVTSSSTITAAPTAYSTSHQQQALNAATTSSGGGPSFYQHHGSGTALHDANAAAATSRAPQTDPDARSYVPSLDDDDNASEEEYMLDEHGHVRRDALGNPISYPRGPASEESDEARFIEREREYARLYGTAAQQGTGGGAGRGSGSGTGRGAGGGATGGPVGGGSGGVYTSNGDNLYGASSGGGGGAGSANQGNVDYSGAGYGWEAMVPRHRHPTRLSDVLEEDERSRTSPSRASERSRGAR